MIMAELLSLKVCALTFKKVLVLKKDLSVDDLWGVLRKEKENVNTDNS